MYLFLLAIIYVAFISLGLPDALLGSAWPNMHQYLNVPVSYAGIITIIIAAGTIVSSLKSDYLTRKYGTGLITACSVAMTACALFGFSISHSFLILCLFAIPYGLGAGAVDAGINNYVALHYKSSHMNWLHSFWGVGASIGPYIMAFSLINLNSWNGGYRIVSIIQIILTCFLFITIPLWKKRQHINKEETEILSIREVLEIRGVSLILITFFCCCAFEHTAGIWATTYLTNHYGMDANIAASYGAYVYLGITGGRFACGFFSNKVGYKHLVRGSLIVMFIGSIFINIQSVCLLGLIIVGVGVSPVFPAIIHYTPINFEAKYSGAIIGIEMASAYVGIIVAPAVFGFISDYLSMGIYPFYLGILVVLMIIFSERFNKIMSL
ncbi:MFS transporter [Candidatus Epulonipiscium fishelsonii]|uniref:MFS transporter n=1 Tax=Candidatus Epulonipiscium fishelsonii TaxID=77094 RepID=A0ACC8X9H9_9FIRM|nr:MFS transporter [Epulopiscium sp. SCG-B11WGA-EpuloA1]